MEISQKDRRFAKSTITSPDLDAINSARVAFLTHRGSPADGDWISAEFVDGKVRKLIGPDAHVLAPATYVMWVELDAPPELIREPAPGEVRILP